MAIMGGVSNALQLGLSALLIKKFCPSKATFGSALGAGIGGIVATAMTGAAAVYLERQNSFLRDDEEKAYLRERVDSLKAQIFKLKERLNESEEPSGASLDIFEDEQDFPNASFSERSIDNQKCA